MHNAVRTPRPPRLGNFQYAFRAMLLQRLLDAEVGVRKSIGPIHCAHRDVMRRPVADSRQFTKAPNRLLRIGTRLERNRPMDNRFGESANRFHSGWKNAEYGDCPGLAFQEL